MECLVYWNVEDVEKMTKAMKAVSDADVHVVDEAFLDDVATATDIAQAIMKHAISSWGSDVRFFAM